MSGTEGPPQGDPAGARFRPPNEGWLARGHAGLIGTMNGIGSIGIVLLMILINADIFGRNLFSSPVLGVPEMVRLVIVGIVFLQAAHTLASGRLTRSTLGLDFVARRWPAVARSMNCAFHLLGAALFAVIAWGAWPQFVRALTRGEYLGAQGVFTVSVWPVKALVVFGCVMLSLQFCIGAWRALRAGEQAR